MDSEDCILELPFAGLVVDEAHLGSEMLETSKYSSPKYKNDKPRVLKKSEGTENNLTTFYSPKRIFLARIHPSTSRIVKHGRSFRVWLD